MDTKLNNIELLLLSVLSKIEHLGYRLDSIYNHCNTAENRIIYIEKDLYRLKLQHTASSPPPMSYRIHPRHTYQRALTVFNPYFHHQQSYPRTTPHQRLRKNINKHSPASKPASKPATENIKPPAAASPINHQHSIQTGNVAWTLNHVLVSPHMLIHGRIWTVITFSIQTSWTAPPHIHGHSPVITTTSIHSISRMHRYYYTH